MKTMVTVFVFGALAGYALAQDSVPAQPRRSLAEGLVRQWVDREKLAPPRLESGLEMGAGDGPMVLMIRRADGTVALDVVERGPGDHGPAAEKRRVEPIAEKEALDKKDAPDKKRVAGSRPAPVADASVLIRRSGNEVSVGTPDEPKLVTGAAVDRARLQPALTKSFGSTRDPELQRQLTLDIEPEALMQDVLTTWEVARAVGFSVVMLKIAAADKHPASAADKERIASLAATHGWTVERGRGRQPICDGELLILVDGSTRYKDVVSLFVECARAGIWQIGFVGQKDARTRFKLPMHLPFDHGR